MKSNIPNKRVAILGGGPSALFVYKRFVETEHTNIEIHIFESKNKLGAGMPYSSEGANHEHVTNVSDNEVPQIVTSIGEWVQTLPDQELAEFGIDKKRFNEYKVLPRLFFGQYLSAQFDLLLSKAKKRGLVTHVHLGRNVIDIADDVENKQVAVTIDPDDVYEFDHVIICTGHKWPKKNEGKIKGYFDSPYPPAKLELRLNHPVAIKGSSLTAIDAIRTLARNNGLFQAGKDGRICFVSSEDNPEFRIIMHSRSGLLPAIRFHLEEPLLSTESLLTDQQLEAHIDSNGGFLSLDYIFENDFKELFKEKDPEFYQRIKDQNLETFVNTMMEYRERMAPFALFEAEYQEAERSISKRESIYWKEMLAVLSFAMNYPAKYLSAEDMLRLQKVLMPLISIVIAFVPQSSAEELLALHRAGKLEIISVGDDSSVRAESDEGATYSYTDESGQSQNQYYQTYIDCVGQPHLSYNDFPFKGLLKNGTLSPARIRFRSAQQGAAMMAEDDSKVVSDKSDYFLKVPGITINDNFQVVGQDQVPNARIYIMAVPYIGGYNPDYSGLDFCEQASENIVESIINNH